MAGLFDDETVVKQWRYTITKLTMKIPSVGNVEIEPEKIKYIQIVEDYENNVFPIFRLHVTLEPSLYYTILKQKRVVKITIIMKKYYQTAESTAVKGASVFLEETFQLVMNDDTDDLLRSQKMGDNYNDYKRTVRDDRNDLQQVDNTIELFMFKGSSLDKAKEKNINAILNKATVTDAIAYICSKAGLKNILMGPADNNTTYDYILIPPLSALKAILYIDTYYGIYKTGSMIYFGIEYTYIIPYSANCVAYENNNNKTIQIAIPKTDNIRKMTIQGELDSGGASKNCILADYRSIDIQNRSIANNYIEANDAQVVDSYSGDVDNESSGADSNENYIRLLENKSENKYVAKIYTAQTKSDSVVVNCLLQDIDSRVITPNKKYELNFEDNSISDKYRGGYIITSATHTFTNTGEEVKDIGTSTKNTAFHVTTELVLKKTGL